MQQNKEYSVVFIGEEGAGKTNLFNILSTGASFTESPVSLSGMQTMTKEYEGQNFSIEYCDFAPGTSSNDINTVLNSPVTKVIAVVFDGTNKNWLSNLMLYFNKMQLTIPEKPVIIFIANKMDKSRQNQESIKEVAEAYINVHYPNRSQYIEVSAKDGLELDDLNVRIETIITDEPFEEIDENDSFNGEGNDSIYDDIDFLSPLHTDARSLISDGHKSSAVEQRKLSPATLQLHNKSIAAQAQAILGLSAADGSKERSKRRRSMPTSANQVQTTTPPNVHDTYFSIALRLAGMALILAALINLIYLILVAFNVLNPILLTVGVNKIITTVGGLLGLGAPEALAAYANTCGLVGLSTNFASGLISTAGSMLFAGIGYGLFKAGKPVVEEVAAGVANQNHRTPVSTGK